VYKKLGSSLGLAIAILIAFASIASAQTDCPQGYAEGAYPILERCETSASDSTLTSHTSQEDCTKAGHVWKTAVAGTCSTHGDGSDANAPDVTSSTFGLQMMRDTAWEYAPVAIALIAAIFGFLLTFALIRMALLKAAGAMKSTV
jgi:uncharacterized membrane protein